MLVSIVIPVYNGAATIGPLAERLIEVLGGDGLELVLVNDASQDHSHQVCLDLQKRYPQVVRYLLLARNFGEHNAVMAGLNHAAGDYVVIMDDDFQNPPEEVYKLVQAAVEGGYDVVYSRYDVKRHHWFRNLGSRLTNLAADFMLQKPHGLYLSSFKCLNRFLVDEIIKYDGYCPYIDGLILRTTRRIGQVTVRHDQRREGRSGYTLRKLVRLQLDLLINFSLMPLRVSFLLGLIFGCLGLLGAVWVVIEKFLYPHIQQGWASMLVIILVFGGMQFMIMGLVGEYLGRVLLSANKNPQYVIRERHGLEEPPA